MEYNFRSIEKKWQAEWKAQNSYKVSNNASKPKFYVLDMFPYPSGTGLHVGHPLGYIASDIYSRHKRLKGFNVLHPMGYDSFGLPAEQYAIEHGIHPAVSTANNIQNFRTQLDKIGFCYDWSREVQTSDPAYYKWTQWIFLQLFDSWFNKTIKKAERISVLVATLEKEGNIHHECPGNKSLVFSAEDWKNYSEKEQQDILMDYRLAFCGYGEVNWCDALGCVLANDEVINGVSERGGFPVVRKKLRQWNLRITEYADRLLDGLQQVDFSESMKDMQANWVGKSYGAEIDFEVAGFEPYISTDVYSALLQTQVPTPVEQPVIRVYTTRPETIFGVDFMVIAPEHEMIASLTTIAQQQQVDEYLAYVNSRSERERMAEKKITGVFTGSYCVNPFNGQHIPIWISEYVLAGYGTGAIMAVPCGDDRDYKFAKHFSIPITNILGDFFNGVDANPTKDAILQNSGFLNGMKMSDGLTAVLQALEDKNIGKRKVNYRMRDAAFSRQRYWGEPFPIIWKNGIAIPMKESELPVLLPQLDELKPGPDGEGPLGNLPEWKNVDGGVREVNTMPGYAGSSWYFLRYMDPHNTETFCSREASDYWNQVDLYIGGTEHAVGHLLYSRLWTKILFDLGYLGFDEPYKKLVNQGKIGGDSRLVYRIRGTKQFVSAGLKDQYETDELHADVTMVDGLELDTKAFRQWKPDYHQAEFILENGKYICGSRLEKMSKRYFNVVNPDDVVERYGADTFRMYEMFLGPVEQDKPWDTKGIEGVHRFLKKLWRLFVDEEKGKVLVVDTEPSDVEWKALYKMVKKVDEDTERFSFNTVVSAFMIGLNEIAELKCHKKKILDKLAISIAAFAPHIAEELWHISGNTTSVLDAQWPAIEEKYLVESSKMYPIAINGKTRAEMNIALDLSPQEVEAIVMADALVQKWLDGKPPKKFIFVKNKMINIVL
jgi:leucyl-tRNA synthetase